MEEWRTSFFNNNDGERLLEDFKSKNTRAAEDKVKLINARRAERTVRRGGGWWQKARTCRSAAVGLIPACHVISEARLASPVFASSVAATALAGVFKS